MGYAKKNIHYSLNPGMDKEGWMDAEAWGRNTRWLRSAKLDSHSMLFHNATEGLQKFLLKI